MKKGAYDLGRKSLYYIVAIMIIALMFVYTSNVLYRYQEKGFKNLEGMQDLGTINKINSCFYYEDKETGRIYPNTVDLDKFNQENLEKCSDTAVIVTLTRFTQAEPTTLKYKPENLIDKQRLRRLVTVKNKGAEEEGLLQLEIAK